MKIPEHLDLEHKEIKTESIAHQDLEHKEVASNEVAHIENAKPDGQLQRLALGMKTLGQTMMER